MRQLILWSLILMLLLSGCRASSHAAPPVPPETAAHPKSDPTAPSAKPATPSTAPSDAVSPRGQLMGKAEDRSEAEEIAALYGITLIDFGYGLALYHTEEDPEAVIARGEENGWPPLSLNRTKKTQ